MIQFKKKKLKGLSLCSRLETQGRMNWNGVTPDKFKRSDNILGLEAGTRAWSSPRESPTLPFSALQKWPTVVWEIFVVKIFRVTIFRELNFRFRGHPRKFITGFIEKIYCARRQDGWVRKSFVCSWLSRLSWNLGGSCWTICEREPRNAKDRYAVAVYKTVASLTYSSIKLPLWKITSCCSHAKTAGIPAWTLALYLLYIVSPPFLLASGFSSWTARFASAIACDVLQRKEHLSCLEDRPSVAGISDWRTISRETTS